MNKVVDTFDALMATITKLLLIAFIVWAAYTFITETYDEAMHDGLQFQDSRSKQ